MYFQYDIEPLEDLRLQAEKLMKKKIVSFYIYLAVANIQVQIDTDEDILYLKENDVLICQPLIKPDEKT